MSNSTENLRQVIEEAFPKTAMPEPSSIFDDCHPEHASLTADMTEIKGEFDSTIARIIHQELRWLNPIGFVWVMPYYLDFCLSEDGQYSTAETQFLIFLFSPESKHREKELARYDFLSADQLHAISLFFVWCKEHNDLGLLSIEHLDAANQFIAQALIRRK